MLAVMAVVGYTTSIDDRPKPIHVRMSASPERHEWIVVLQARRQDTARAMEALGRLCQTYWYPLYAYVRLRGHSPEEAKELTQEFFSRLLQNKTLAYMTRDCGKFL